MFGFTKPTFLGIDFGTSSIKAVEVTVHKGTPHLKNYAEIKLVDLEMTNGMDQGQYDAEVTKYLRALLERLNPTTNQVYVAMPAFIGLVALVEFPRMSEKELEAAIRFEAHKYIPSPLEEVALSWEVVGEIASATEGPDRIEVLLVAALNKEVERYESYVRAVKCDMQLLELETFSMVRSVVNGDSGLFLLVDIGSRATNLVLVENGLVKVSRNLDVGGRDITQTLALSLHISEDEAKIMKKGAVDYVNESSTKLVFPALETIAAEMDRMLSIHQTKHPETAIDGIILSGGTAALTGLTTYYSTLFGLSVTVGNPWQRVAYPPKIQGAIQRMGTSFSVALGLALQGANQFLEKRKRVKPQDSTSQGNRWQRLLARLKEPIGGGASMRQQTVTRAPSPKPTAPAVVSQIHNKSFLVRLVYRTGLISTDRQAQYVLLIVALIISAVAIALPGFFLGSATDVSENEMQGAFIPGMTSPTLNAP